MAQEAIRIIERNFAGAVAKGNNIHARERKSMATCLPEKHSRTPDCHPSAQYRTFGGYYEGPSRCGQCRDSPPCDEFKHAGNLEKFAKIAQALGSKLKN
jgi:alcohol dehydrogenase class IV